MSNISSMKLNDTLEKQYDTFDMTPSYTYTVNSTCYESIHVKICGHSKVLMVRVTL